MSQWDKVELIVLSVLAVLITVVDFPKGAAFYRAIFNLSVILFLGLLYALPLLFMGLKPAWTTSNWFTIGAFVYYKAIFIVSVFFLIKRDRFYFWIIRKLR